MVKVNATIRSASRVLIAQHGAEAPHHGTMIAEECLAVGDWEGRAVWLQITRAVETLLFDDLHPSLVRH